MKNLRKLIPAIAMLMVAVTLLSTGSYAWFSMNTQVKATGMQVKAQAEGGIVISNESTSDWKASATASHNTSVELVPTSTSDVATWYHATSDDADSAKPQQASDAYTTLDITETSGVGAADIGTENKNVYLLNKFYIKSSAEAITLTSGLYINNVVVTGASTSAALDAALRVAVKIGGQVYIFAPVTNGATNYKVKNTTTVNAIAAGTKNTATTVMDIPVNTTEAPIQADIYIYFEGEDPACKSNNITSTLDTLTVEVTFGTTQIA